MALNKNLLMLLLVPFFLGAAYSCSPLVIDSAAYALEAGQATMLLGSCQRPIAVGYDACWFERGSVLPKLQLMFMNPAEYAVSDCAYGIYKTGSIDEPGTVEIDLEPLNHQIAMSGFCLLRVEAREFFPDPNDENQMKAIPLAGGWFIEMFEPGYNPTPANAMVGWCYQVKRTTSGRTTVEDCP